MTNPHLKLVLLFLFSLQWSISWSQSLPIPIFPKGLKEIKVVSGTASEYRNQATSTKYSPASSFDNKLDTEYHSIKGATVFPVTLNYQFEAVSRLSKLDYYPRTDVVDIDGHWKELVIKVRYADNTTEEVFNNVGNGFTQFNRAYSEEEKFFHTIDLGRTYENVKGVEFIFYSGQKNMITVAELDFWESSVSQFDPQSIFSDNMFTQLKEGVTSSDINSISDNDYFKNYALDLFNSTYEKEFRVQKYKAYPHPSSVGGDLRIYNQSRCSNVTGIYLQRGDEIFVVSDQDVNLLQVDFWPHAPGDPTAFDPQVNPLDDQQVYYSLKKGINRIKAEQNGLFYVQYWSDDYANLPEVELHFMYGRINGYFDGRVRTREEWSQVLSIAKYPYYDVIGEYVQITFPLIGFKELTDNGKDLIDLYDELNYLARKIHGHIDIPGSEIPNHSHVAGVYKKYKYAAPYAVFYNISDANGGWQNVPTLDKNFNAQLLKDDFFGTVHEWGHSLQIRQALNWGNLTEVTCNIAANYALDEKLGPERSKEMNPSSGFSTQYESAWNTFFVKNQSFADGLSPKMPMFWQLYLYCTKVLGISDFYPKVHELARNADSKLIEEDAMLNFTYLVALSASKDFTSFFEKWKFYKEGTFVAGDYYGNDTFEMTPALIEQYKTKVAALGYQKVNDAVEYITDSNFNLFKNKTNVVVGTYELNNNQLTPSNWTGVVVFENYLDGKLANVNLKAIPITISSQNVKQEIYAVQYDGTRYLVYGNTIEEDCPECSCGPQLEQINQEVLDRYKNDNSKNFLPIPSGLSNRAWVGSKVGVTLAQIEENFTAARNLDQTVYAAYKSFEFPSNLKVKVCSNGGEVCSESEKIEKWFLLSYQEKALFLLNAERAARGLPTFQGVSTELAAIAQQYADALAQNNSGLSHNLPLTLNGVNTNTPWERIDSDLSIKNNREFYGFSENLAYLANNPTESNIPIEHAIYSWNYDDASSNWGHRNFNLSILNDNSGNENEEGVLGFGVKKVVESSGWKRFYIVMNAVDPTETWNLDNLLIYCNANNSIDTQAPVLTLSSPYTVRIPESGTFVLEASSLDNGSTDNVGITEFSLSKSSFTCADLGTNTVTVTAKDAAGNTASAEVTVIVEDQIKPVITAKSSHTLVLDSNGNATLSWEDVDQGSTDNCAITTKTLSKTAFSCADLGTTTVTLTAKDASDNTTTASVTITVVDQTKPVIVAKSSHTLVLDDNGNATLSWEDVDQGSTDNCAITTKTLSKTAFSCADLGTKTITLTAKDASDNTTTAVVNVTVVDQTKPVIVARSSLTLVLNANGNATLRLEDVDQASTDNCGISQRTLSKTSFTTSDLGENRISYTVTDQSGNSSTSELVVTVVDGNSTQLLVKSTYYLILNGSGNALLRWEDVVEYVNQSAGITSITLDKTDFTCSDLGTKAVTLTANFASGNTTKAVVNVTVVDQTKPVIVAKSSHTLVLDANGNATLNWGDVDQGSTDNCAITTKTLSKTAFSCADLGTKTITLTAKDASGNTTTASVTITVVDQTKPVIVAKSSHTLVLDGNGNATLSWEDVDQGSTDNCAITTKTLSKTAFSCADLGTKTVTLTAKDASGNTITALVTITVVDQTKPVIVAKSSHTLVLDGNGNATLSWADVDQGSTDNCAITTKTLSKTAFSCADLGTKTITLTAKDASGNTTTASVTITVVDQTKPVIVANSSHTLVLNGNGNATLIWEDVDQGSTDNCGISQRTLSKTSFTTSDLGENRISYTITDQSGNSFTKELVVTVVDRNSTQLQVKSAYYLNLNGSGNALLKWEDVVEYVNQSAGITSITLNKTEFTCSDLGTKAVTLTAKDASGNKTTAVVNVTVVDQTKPVIVAKSSHTLVLDANGNATLNWGDVDQGSTDNCSITTRILSKTVFSCADLGTKTITLTAKDATGNSTTVSVEIEVMDQTKPVILAKSSYTLPLNSNGYATLSWEDVDQGSKDNCSLTTKTLSKSSFTCADLGTTTVTLTAKDASGNTSTEEVEITVVDEFKPTLKVKTNYTIKLDGSGTATLKWEDIDEGSTDNCSITLKTISKPDFSCSDLGENKITVTAKDAAGNTSTAEVTVIVVDEIKPTLKAKASYTIKLDGSGTATLKWEDVDQGSTDNCSITTKTLSKTAFSCADLGTTTVTLTAKDATGNTSTADVTVIVVDEIKPTLKAKTSYTIKLDTQGKATLKWEDLDEGSSDNCSIKDRSLSKSEFTRTDGGESKITYTVTDVSGNTSSVEVTVRVDIVLASPERPKEANFLRAYPNPVNDYLYLEFAEGISTSAIRSSSLVDASGRVLGKLSIEDGGNGLLVFSTQSLTPGMYFLRLSTRDTLHLIKFTVIH